jgi:hypothetical protein
VAGATSAPRNRRAAAIAAIPATIREHEHDPDADQVGETPARAIETTLAADMTAWRLARPGLDDCPGGRLDDREEDA